MKLLSGELVFAFGSNLSLHQFARRCPSWEWIARAELPDHELAFGGYSQRWRGAVATFREAPRRRLRGVIFAVSRLDLARLDRFEGVPRVYDRHQVLVRVLSPRAELGLPRKLLLRAHTYRMVVGTDGSGTPSPAYLSILAEGYRDWGFDRRHLRRAVRASAIEAL